MLGLRLGVMGLLVVGMLGGLVGCASPTKYDAATHGTNLASEAGSFWKKDGWWSLKTEDRKVMITEFSVEYVTENRSDLDKGQLGLLTVMEVAGVGKRKREFAPDFKRTLPTELYEKFVQQLTTEGFTVLPMAQVTGHAMFKKLSGAAAGEEFTAAERNVLGGVDHGQNRSISVYPVRGLPIVDDSWFKGIGNAEAENTVAGELGAQLALRVRIRVALDDDGRVVLDEGSTFRVLSRFKSGAGWGGKTNYYPETSGSVRCHHAMRDDVPVVSKQEFRAFEGEVYKIDSQKYKTSLLKMYPNFARMAVIKLKD